MSISMQEYYDQCCEHMIRQGERAIGDTGCAYLTGDGLKCAVGFFIPDGHPAQHSSGSVMGLAIDHPDLAGIAWPDSESGVQMAQDLQDAHDGAFNWSKIHGFVGFEALADVANQYGLKPYSVGEHGE